MATQYDTWLSTLGSLRADMPMTVRGKAILHEVTYPGDVTTATLSGSVKAAPDSATELAVFTVGTPVFSGGLTAWPVSLSAAQTGGLPSDAAGDGLIVLIYDFVFNLAGDDPQRLFGGLFPVSGFVTE